MIEVCCQSYVSFLNCFHSYAVIVVFACWPAQKADLCSELVEHAVRCCDHCFVAQCLDDLDTFCCLDQL